MTYVIAGDGNSMEVFMLDRDHDRFAADMRGREAISRSLRLPI